MTLFPLSISLSFPLSLFLCRSQQIHESIVATVNVFFVICSCWCCCYCVQYLKSGKACQVYWTESCSNNNVISCIVCCISGLARLHQFQVTTHCLQFVSDVSHPLGEGRSFLWLCIPTFPHHSIAACREQETIMHMHSTVEPLRCWIQGTLFSRYIHSQQGTHTLPMKAM